MTMPVFFIERIITPIGLLLTVTDQQGRLRATDWEGYEQRLEKMLRRHCGTATAELREATHPSAARAAIEDYFAGGIDALNSITTATNGTAFQRLVWDALRRIEAGGTVSYGALAAQINHPAAARAVGLANGANPICIVVPCHRVIGADASLTGFAGGLARKRWLLDHERNNIGHPTKAMPIPAHSPFSSPGVH